MKTKPAKNSDIIAIFVSAVGSEVNDKRPAKPMRIIMIPIDIKDMERIT
jgi:hypothetical protein